MRQALSLAALLLAILSGPAAAATASTSPGRSTSPDGARGAEARVLLREILATPEFARVAGPSALDRLSSRIRRWFADLLLRTGLLGTAGTRLASTVAWAVAILAVAALGYLLVRSRRRRTARPGDPAAGLPARRTSSEWVACVAEAMNAGDVREAVRFAHVAVVARFEEQGIWRPDETRTPREYARLVPHRDDRHVPFNELTAEFERSWYGRQPANVNRLWQWLEACGCPPHHRAT